MGEKPNKDRDKFIVRLPDGMRDRLAVAATLNQRSMTAELVARLQASFAQDDAPDAPAAGGLADEMLRMMDKFGTLRGQVHKLQEADAAKTFRIDDLEARLAKLEGKAKA